MGKRSSSRVAAENMKTRRNIKKSQEKSRTLAGKDGNRKPRKILDEIELLPSEKSLAERPSFVKETSREDGVVLAD